MDPRPYHFDYRRPRVTNPTYLSKQLYDRIHQHQQSASNDIPINPELKRANSTNLRSQNKSQLDHLSYRYDSRGVLPSSEKSKPSSELMNNSMAHYGRNVLGRSNSSRREQEDIFEKQERNFNIISYWPRAVQPTLHQFPKLTLEDKLLENNISTKH